MNVYEVMAQQSAELRHSVNGQQRRYTVSTGNGAQQHLDAARFSQYDGREFATAEVEGLGKVRIVTFSARKAMDFRKILKRKEAGDDVDLDIARLILVGGVVDDAGVAVFDNDSVEHFLDRITPDMLNVIVTQVTKLQTKNIPEGKANPSSASPSAA